MFKSQELAIVKCRRILNRPMAPNSDSIGIISPDTNDSMYFEPWDILDCVYGTYSEEFDDLAIEVLTDILNTKVNRNDLAAQMFREMLCVENLCDYGSSPRRCFPTSRFKEILPELIEKWKDYSKVCWAC